MPFFNRNDDDDDPPWDDHFKGREVYFKPERNARDNTRQIKFNIHKSVQFNRATFAGFLEHPLALAILKTPSYLDFAWLRSFENRF